MLFDFDRFTTTAKLAYRRCAKSTYSLEDVLSVFRHYFETYEFIRHSVHPMISVNQTARIIEKMPQLEEAGLGSLSATELYPDDYPQMIDQHFATTYSDDCDYNINHFFTGSIRNYRYSETLY